MADAHEAGDLVRMLDGCARAREILATADDHQVAGLRADVEEWEQKIRAELDRLRARSAQRSRDA